MLGAGRIRGPRRGEKMKSCVECGCVLLHKGMYYLNYGPVCGMCAEELEYEQNTADWLRLC
jgi:formylmethanofuran dehydrogenase subunit E